VNAESRNLKSRHVSAFQTDGVASSDKSCQAASQSLFLPGCRRNPARATRRLYRSPRARQPNLGEGSATFDRAVQALHQWKMFDVPGIQFYWPATAIQPGETVAIVIRHFGFWSLNCCKIVYVIDEEGPVRRFGFAYGTLPEHAEQGEEHFTVEWQRTPDVVSYHILSFSRPVSLAARVACRLARRLQKCFVRQSLAAVEKAVKAEQVPFE
jgi:uncharacterized protein (UPF0548 family)